MVIGLCLSACGTGSDDDGASPPTSLSAAESVGPAAPDAFVALFECFVSHGVDARDPAQPSSVPVASYPPEVATDAWGACRETYLDALRLFVAGFNVAAGLPSEAAPLAFADCMATFGWVSPGVLPGPVVVEDLAGYLEANAVCRSPVEGEPVEASYCRFLHAIADRATHDPSMSTTGSPYAGTLESRRQAAVDLYDEALQIAPEALTDVLHTLQEGFRREGTDIPDAVWESLINYHLSMCGAWVYLGSLD